MGEENYQVPGKIELVIRADDDFLTVAVKNYINANGIPVDNLNLGVRERRYLANRLSRLNGTFNMSVKDFEGWQEVLGFKYELKLY